MSLASAKHGFGPGSTLADGPAALAWRTATADAEAMAVEDPASGPEGGAAGSAGGDTEGRVAAATGPSAAATAPPPAPASRLPGGAVSITLTTMPSRCRRCWPAVTIRSPSSMPSRISTRPGRRIPTLTSTRWAIFSSLLLPSTSLYTTTRWPCGTMASSGTTLA